MTIWFDLDGTLSNMYGVPNWLSMLRSYNPAPYEYAAPLLNMATLARQLNAARRKGFEIGIISWCSKCSTPEFDEATRAAKMRWLRRHLPSVEWDYIKIVPYGTNKFQECGEEGILFDDEEGNREKWANACAWPPELITEVLGNINRNLK